MRRLCAKKLFTQCLSVKGGLAYGTEHEICRESASRPIFLSFYLPASLSFYFPASPSLFLFLAFLRVFSNPLSSALPAVVLSTRYPSRYWHWRCEVDSSEGAERSAEMVTRCGGWCKKKKTLLDLVLYPPCIRPFPSAYLSWSPLFVHPITWFATMGNERFIRCGCIKHNFVLFIFLPFPVLSWYTPYIFQYIDNVAK